MAVSIELIALRLLLSDLSEALDNDLNREDGSLRGLATEALEDSYIAKAQALLAERPTGNGASG